MKGIQIIIILLLVAISIPVDRATGREDIDIRAYIVGETLEDMEDIRGRARELGLEMEEPLKYAPFQLVVFRSRSRMREVLSWEGVKRIQEEARVEASMDTSVRNVKAAPSEEYSPDTAHERGYRGEGMTIAIIDSGVDNERHPTFMNCFAAGADFTSPESPLNPRDGSVDPDDLDGHGTGVASVALGRGEDIPNSRNVGVAPMAGLIDLRIRILGPTMENPIAAALEWCIDHKDTDWGNGYNGVDVISVSAGLGRPDGPVHEIVSRCVENGIPVISAATNSGESFEDNPNGPNYWSDDAIIVGGTDDMGTVDRSDDEYWPQSTWGPRTDDGDDNPYDELKPDISAPASNILVAEASDKDSPGPVVGSTVVSGTSYATPHVSGTVALMLQANPEIRPGPGRNPVRKILHGTAEARGEPYDGSLSEKYNVHYGYGILDSNEAVTAARDHRFDNSPPRIREFSIVPSPATVGSTCSVIMDAYDPDEEPLTYEFSAEAGEITGEFPDLYYHAPGSAGTYLVEAVVYDTHGASDSGSFAVEVTQGEPNDPPRIISMEAVPEEIGFEERSVITVNARDPDGDQLEYLWSSSSGSLEADGSVATLTAGNTAGTITVEVTVRDPFNAEDSDRVRIRVTGDPTGNPPFISSVELDPDSMREGDTSRDVFLKAEVTSSDSVVDTVRADLSSMGMGKLDLSDNGEFPDEQAGDNVYSLKLPPVVDLETGSYEILLTAVDIDGRETTTSISFNVQGPLTEKDISGENGASMNTVLLITLMVAAALILVFVIVRITKRTPR